MDPERSSQLAARYVRGLKIVKQEQPLLSSLRRQKKRCSEFLLSNVPHSTVGEYRQGSHHWIMCCNTQNLPPTVEIMEGRLSRQNYSAEDIQLIRKAGDQLREELRVVTSIDYDGMDRLEDEEGEGDDIAFATLGHALYTYRKLDYENREQQKLVTNGRRLMRMSEKEIVDEVKRNGVGFRETVDDVDVSIGVKSMLPTTSSTHQYLVDNGMASSRADLYLRLKRRPVQRRGINNVTLRIDRVLQPSHELGVYIEEEDNE